MSGMVVTFVREMLGKPTVYWMRESTGKVSVCAYMRERFGRLSGDRAKAVEKELSRVVRLVHADASKHGALVRSEGDGLASVMEVAEMPWSPRVENELSRLGVVELK